MTVRRNSNAWHRQPVRNTYGTAPSRRVLKLVAVAAILGIGLSSAAVANWNGPTTTEYIGICHATGSETNPFVFLVAPLNGYEHAHHRHHESDYFVDPATAGCFQVPGVTPEPLEPEVPSDGNETIPADGNETIPPEPVGNATDEPASPAEPAENETEPEESELPPPGDAALTQSATQDDFQATLTFVVTSIGDGVAEDVSLQDLLPDLRRPWYLGGADSAQCVLEGRSIECWFGDLEPGATRTVYVQAYTDRMPCGQSLTSTAWVSSEADAEPRNDGSSASIAARAC